MELKPGRDEISHGPSEETEVFDEVYEPPKLNREAVNHDAPISVKEDLFELQLIQTVQKNQVLFDRDHALHKDMHHRQKLWNKLAKDLGFNGSGSELEKKWRRMRDRYVRLKKVDPSTCPLREGEKWSTYYKRMRFLDPYIEHRSRVFMDQQQHRDHRRHSHSDHSDMNIFASRSDADPLEARPDEIVDGDTFDDDEPLFRFVGSDGHAIKTEPTDESLRNSATSASSSHSAKETTPVDFVDQRLAASLTREEGGQTEASISRKRPRDDENSSAAWRIAEKLLDQHQKEETEVSLYIRSIAKTLEQMDPRAFARARIRISEVLYECQFGEQEKTPTDVQLQQHEDA